MSLRTRLVASVFATLLLSLGAGLALTGWHAARSVRTELEAALAVGEQTVSAGMEELSSARGGSRDPAAELVRLVRAFDGDRHLRARLTDGAGRSLAASVVATPAQPVPRWFVRLVAPKLAPVQVPAGRSLPDGAVLLEAEPLNEAGEAWVPLLGGLAVVALFCGGTALLISVVVSRALRPLALVGAALEAVGSGEYAARVPQGGAPELAQLARGFNLMAERLGAAEAEGRRLHDQLLALQDEERAELARELHDEVGPYLFAASLDAAAIEGDAAAGRHGGVPERARALRDAVGHVQRHVRAVLRRLRPANPVEIGLAPALGNLVAFWRARRPGVLFALDVAADEDHLGEAATAVIYRVVQEGLSNAVRHGAPSRIGVEVRAGPGGAEVRVTDDGVGLGGGGEPGFGLAGMRERVTAIGGTLHVGARAEGKGLAVTARLPAGAGDPSAGLAGQAVAA